MSQEMRRTLRTKNNAALAANNRNTVNNKENLMKDDETTLRIARGKIEAMGRANEPSYRGTNAMEVNLPAQAEAIQALEVVKNDVLKNSDKPQVFYMDSGRFYKIFMVDADDFLLSLHDELEGILGYDPFPYDDNDCEDRLWSLIYEQFHIMLPSYAAALELGFGSDDELFDFENSEGLLCDKFIVVDRDSARTYYLNLDICKLRGRGFKASKSKTHKETAN